MCTCRSGQGGCSSSDTYGWRQCCLTINYKACSPDSQCCLLVWRLTFLEHDCCQKDCEELSMFMCVMLHVDIRHPSSWFCHADLMSPLCGLAAAVCRRLFTLPSSPWEALSNCSCQKGAVCVKTHISPQQMVVSLAILSHQPDCLPGLGLLHSQPSRLLASHHPADKILFMD